MPKAELRPPINKLAFWILLATLVSVGGSVAAAGSLKMVVEGLDTLANVVTIEDNGEKVFALEQFTGKIRLIYKGVVLENDFIDVGNNLIEDANHEEGLLGLAVAPAAAGEGAAFVSYVDRAGDLVLSRFRVSDDGRRALPETEEIVFRADRAERQHHCGHLAFGPKDGRLYLCIGDTQSNFGVVASAPVSQDLARPQGKILRFEAPGGMPLGEGPIITGHGLPAEVVVYGLRNPWRFGFDPVSGDLFIPDVGRRHWEELNVRAGDEATVSNFGWPLAEGNECLLDCSDDEPELVWPVFEYAHQAGRCSVIGGAVYRGRVHPAWHGVYVFADLCSGEIWAVRDALGEAQMREIVTGDFSPVAIERAGDGEILIASAEGGVYRLRMPEDFKQGWQSVDQLAQAEALAAKRSAFGHALDEYRAILQSRRWQVAKLLGRMYEWLP